MAKKLVSALAVDWTVRTGPAMPVSVIKLRPNT